MSRRAVAAALLGCVIVVSSNGAVFARASAARTQRVALDDLLAAYLAGDTDVVGRTFVRTRDFQDKLRISEPRELDRWLGEWHRPKAMLLLELADVASRVAHQYTAVLVRAGQRYIADARDRDAAQSPSREFVELWHRAAAGLVQLTAEPRTLEEYVDVLVRRARGQPIDPRLILAQAVAHERRCWSARPSLDRPSVRVDALGKAAGMAVQADLDAPAPAVVEARAAAHRSCLEEALARFEAAAASSVAAEAGVRAGWILVQLGRFADAARRMEGVDPGDDRDLGYWLGLFRGRAYDRLGRDQDAADAYRSALTLRPAAQSAGIGLSLALVRLNRSAEADEIAQSLRQPGPPPADPWVTYLMADRRFVDGWLAELRASIR